MVLMRLPEGTDFDGAGGPARATWATSAPTRTQASGWAASTCCPSIGTLTPELQFLAVDADQRLVVGSDTEAYAGAGDARP